MSTTGATASEGGAGREAGAASRTVAETKEETVARPARRPGPWWWPRRRSAVLDAVLAVLSALECSAEGASFADRVGVPEPVFMLLGFAAGSALVLRRRWPVAVVLVGLAVAPAQMGVLLGTVGLYTLAASQVPRRITFSLAVLTTVGTLVVTLIDMQNDQQVEDGLPVVTLAATAGAVAIGLTVAPLLLGLYIGARRRLVESLVDRADGLERELALLAEKASERAQRARIEERTRIAREMHDVVAHRVSLMVVHAGALESLALRDPEKAARNAGLVGNMGRQALDELRTMLGVLRANETGGTPGTAGRPQGRAGAAGVRAAAPPVVRADSASCAGDGGAVRVPGDGGDGTGRSAAGAPRGPGTAAGGGVLTGAGTDRGADGVGARPGGRSPAGGRGRNADRGATAGGAARLLGGAVPVPAGSGPAIGEVVVLVEESRAAGMAVELSVEGEERPLAAEAERTAYRVVQEALTKDRKSVV